MSDDSDIEQVMRLLTEVSALLAGRPRQLQTVRELIPVNAKAIGAPW